MSENKNDGIDLSHVIEIPGAAQFEKAVNKWSAKIFASFWADIKRWLSKAAEPFHRKKMGERYYDGDALGGGIALWILSSLCSFLLSLLITLPMLAFGASRLLTTSATCCFFTGAGMVVGTIVLGFDSITHAQCCRNEGIPFHSRSRGVERWGNMTIPVILGISVILIVNPVAWVAWLASLAFAAKLAGEQQAAIYSKYLDAVDQKIENDHLEAAILGEYPIEQTFLHRALPRDIPVGLRKDMAAAAVGKSVTLLARPPQSKAPPVMQPGTPPAQPTATAQATPAASTTNFPLTREKYTRLELPSASLVIVVKFEYEGQSFTLKLEDIINNYANAGKKVKPANPDQPVEIYTNNKNFDVGVAEVLEWYLKHPKRV